MFIVASAENEVQLTILRDGQPVGDASGNDVKNGIVTVKEDRLYRLIDEPKGFSEHTLEIIVENPGAKFFAFTFG